MLSLQLFAASLCLTFLALAWRGKYFYRRFLALSGWLVSKGFGTNNISGFLRLQIPLARVLFGTVLLSRAVLELWAAYDSAALMPWLLAEVIFSLLLMTGALTQWSLIYFMMISWQYTEAVLGSSSLGNDVAAMLAFFLFLTQGGRFDSADSVLIQKFPQVRAFLLYGRRIVSDLDVALIRFTSLVFYQATSFYSLAMHLGEPAWMSGEVGPLLFSDNYMSHFGDALSKLFSAQPILMAVFMGAMFVQMLWFASIVTFSLLGGWARKFIVFWGYGFFVGSLTLQLGSLAIIELIFWALLFGFGVSRRFRRVRGGRQGKSAGLSRAPLVFSTHGLLVALFFVLSLPAPYLDIGNPLSGANLWKAAAPYGVQPIIVFNETDLRMRENWVTIHDSAGFLIPFFNEDGSRGSLHALDSIYFGSSLRFVRGEIGREDCGLERNRDHLELTIRKWRNIVSADAPRKYQITHFRQASPKIESGQTWEFTEKQVQRVCSQNWLVD